MSVQARQELKGVALSQDHHSDSSTKCRWSNDTGTQEEASRGVAPIVVHPFRFLTDSWQEFDQASRSQNRVLMVFRPSHYKLLRFRRSAHP